MKSERENVRLHYATVVSSKGILTTYTNNQQLFFN